jgi:hypothetical protein
VRLARARPKALGELIKRVCASCAHDSRLDFGYNQKGYRSGFRLKKRVCKVKIGRFKEASVETLARWAIEIYAYLVIIFFTILHLGLFRPAGQG